MFDPTNHDVDSKKWTDQKNKRSSDGRRQQEAVNRMSSGHPWDIVRKMEFRPVEVHNLLLHVDFSRLLPIGLGIGHELLCFCAEFTR